MMICHCFSFLIDEIWLDWWNNILLFLFSALTVLNLICGIRAYSIILDRPLRSRGLSLHFGLASGGPGLGEWAGKPIFLTLSKTISLNKQNKKWLMNIDDDSTIVIMTIKQM